MPFIHYTILSLPWMVVRGTRAKNNPEFRYLIQCETFRSCFSCLIVNREQYLLNTKTMQNEGDVHRNELSRIECPGRHVSQPYDPMVYEFIA